MKIDQSTIKTHSTDKRNTQNNSTHSCTTKGNTKKRIEKLIPYTRRRSNFQINTATEKQDNVAPKRPRIHQTYTNKFDQNETYTDTINIRNKNKKTININERTLAPWTIQDPGQ